jgi:hypothetical protein
MITKINNLIKISMVLLGILTKIVLFGKRESVRNFNSRVRPIIEIVLLSINPIEFDINL